MPLAEYFRSTPFKIASTYAGLFAISVALLFGVVYWLVTDEMTGGMRIVIERDIVSLKAAYQDHGAAGLRDAINGRIASDHDKDALYIFRDQYGQLQSGNVLDGEPGAGWHELRIATSPGSDEDDDASGIYLAQGVQFADTFIVVGRSLYRLTEVQEVLLRSFGWAFGLTAIMALSGGVYLGQSALRRIDAINRAFREIMDGHLSQRVPTKGTRDELDRLATNINLMLDRIEQLMADLQQVTNDIAHDLRTPLGRLRHGLESARRKGLSVEDYRTAIDQAIEQTDTILDTFAALLRIAQIEAKARRRHFAAVNLSEISNRIFEAYETVIEDAGQRLSGSIAPNVQVRGDKDLVTQMVANLVENATRHCPAGTQIRISLTNDTAPSLTVTDTGPGIPDEAKEAVLRRFYRMEKSRTTPGNGLGLALVKAIADLHNASLTLSDNQPGLWVNLEFPPPANR